MALVKTAIRVAVIGSLATGVTVLVAGPERVMALAGQARQSVNHVIDAQIDDPVALRHQLRSLESEYPKRIASVRGDLAELNTELAQVHRDKQIAEKVVEMASADHAELGSALAEAEAVRNENPYATIRVRFGGSTMSLDKAFGRGTQINNTINAYSTRIYDAERNVSFLSEQQQRLEELLTELEAERAQFQAQVWQLDNEIAAIERNDRMIDMVEARQKTLEKYNFKAVSLDQVKGAMAKIRTEQEMRLHELANQSKAKNYEQEAEVMIQQEDMAKDVYERTLAPASAPSKVIEVGPNGETVETDSNDRLAYSKPIVVGR
jgi:chromosome segregation ATPase